MQVLPCSGDKLWSWALRVYTIGRASACRRVSALRGLIIIINAASPYLTIEGGAAMIMTRGLRDLHGSIQWAAMSGWSLGMLHAEFLTEAQAMSVQNNGLTHM